MSAALRVYIASNWASRKRLRPMRDALREKGYDVQASWLDAQEEGELPKDKLVEALMGSLGEAVGTDIFILDTLEEDIRGGREAIFGAAFFAGVAVYQVGPERNAFHVLITQRFDSWDALLKHLA